MVLSLLLASCGDSDKDSDSAGSGDGNGKDEPITPAPAPAPAPASASTPTLFIESAPMGTSLNAASYEVSGNCDAGQGDVTITVETSDPVIVECTGDPGAYTASLDISEVEADPMSVTVEQDGNTKNLSPSPANDQDGPASAPTATGPAPNTAVNQASYNLSIVCNEAGEVVSITGSGLNIDPQTHTCTGSGAETFSLNIKRATNISSPNNLTLSSMDQYGNQAGGITMVDVPIDTSALPPIVSVDEASLPDIDSSNAQSFTVGGGCSQEGQPVMVSVGALTPETDPDCTNNLWSVVLDVTGLNKTTGAVPILADHSSSGGVDATQASGSVTNSFICPTNFVAVPSLQDYTAKSFCVMKYEAKNNGSGNAISQAASTPYVDINRDDSITKCQAMGTTGYDLITNDEWQSIARNIELVGSNWKNSTVGDAGGLSTGNNGILPGGSILAANSDDNNACHETGENCSSSTWNSKRRTHTLSNGEVVWDIAGNADEWVKDNNTLNYGGSINASISNLTDMTHPISGSLSDGGTTTIERTAKGHFGPSGDYTNLESTPYGGFGFGSGFSSGSAGGGVSRGGFNDGFAGVFSVYLFSMPSSIHGSLGFRCAYHP